jgi:hypothetical protein
MNLDGAVLPRRVDSLRGRAQMGHLRRDHRDHVANDVADQRLNTASATSAAGEGGFEVGDVGTASAIVEPSIACLARPAHLGLLIRHREERELS